MISLLIFLIIVSLVVAAIRLETYHETLDNLARVQAEATRSNASNPNANGGREDTTCNSAECKACIIEEQNRCQLRVHMVRTKLLEQPQEGPTCVLVTTDRLIIACASVVLVFILGMQISEESTRKIFIGDRELENKICRCGKAGILCAFSPCGHAIVCDRCIHKYGECPQCKAAKIGVIRIEFVN